MHSDLAQAVAFLGNSLLRPMNQTGTYGLDLGFWDAFPTFDDERVSEAIDGMKEYLKAIAPDSEADAKDRAAERISVEFTKLFVGPPNPSVKPWETYYRDKNAKAGYGAVAVDVGKQLRAMGLAIGGEGNQFPDHMGIELLCLSEMLSRSDREALPLESAVSFCVEHPLSWVGELREAVNAEAPGGYYGKLLGITESVLQVVSGLDR